MSHANRRRTGPDHCHDLLAARRRAAFTIIEMLVVLAVVALIVAILLPAIAGVRNSAGKSKTQSITADLGQATQQFMNDNRRVPGYFSIEEMASPGNATLGFSEMENILLDLAGGITSDPQDMGNGDPCSSPFESGSAQGPTVVTVGPTSSTTVNVDLRKIGGSQDGSGYFQLAEDIYKKQCLAVSGFEPGQQAGTVQHRALYDLVDGFGSPMLAWVENDLAGPKPPSSGQWYFTADAHNGPGSPSASARFFLTPNKAFLNVNALGRKGERQVYDSAVESSLLGSGAPDPVQSLGAVVGHPSYPDLQRAHPAGSSTYQPSTSRGAVIFHSAGADGIYLNRKSTGGSIAESQFGGVVVHPLEGDALRRFDDVIYSLGK